MKRGISLPGILLGLAAGLLAGLLGSHLIGWLLAGLAVALVLVAIRLRRGKALSEHVSGNAISARAGARG